MAHVLARVEGVKPEDIKAILARDAADHAKEGLHLEHLWRDVDGPEVLIQGPTCRK